jgi:CTP:molybdopterin cytidylyltransferase MocA
LSSLVMEDDVSVYGFIPARLASTRLPQKLLLRETGKPLIQHTWEAARRAQSLADLIVVTDSEEIAQAARDFGACAEMTGEHPSGTDRIAEVVRRGFSQAEIIVNVQGDEPEIDAAHIDLLVRLLAENPQAQMSTLATPIKSTEQRDGPVFQPARDTLLPRQESRRRAGDRFAVAVALGPVRLSAGISAATDGTASVATGKTGETRTVARVGSWRIDSSGHRATFRRWHRYARRLCSVCT